MSSLSFPISLRRTDFRAHSQFTNVRVPRAYMLMKHTQVTRDGQVFKAPLAQLTYGALLQGRTAMVADAGEYFQLLSNK